VIKRRTQPGGGFWARRPGGRFVAEGVTLKDLLVFAYGVQPYQIVGGPRWLDTERWDVTAAGAPEAPQQVLVALQQLLRDRFSLTLRQEQQDLPIYALVLARDDGRLGPQLKRAQVDCAALQAEALKTGILPPEARAQCRGAQGRIGSIQMAGAPMSELVPLLSTRLMRTVVDRTGLSGAWDLTLTYAPDASQVPPDAVAQGLQVPNDPNAPSLFAAVQEQLGLKLESTRAPVDVLVIAAAEFPREN
jgi:uncharacterized protein (TIGR03435 family)